MKLRRLNLAIILPALLLVSCGSKSSGGGTEELVSVPTMTVTKQSAVLELVYPVEIYGQEDIEVRPRIDGFIRRINVQEGSVVQQGQSLFEIDSPQAEQVLRTAQASVATAEANLATAKVNVDRIRPLAEQGIVSKTQSEIYENAYETAQAALKQAEAALANAKATMEWTYVKSPVDGVVGAIPYRQGSLVNSANSLTTVSNTKSVYVYFSLNEIELTNFLNTLEGTTRAEKLKNSPDVTLILKDGSAYPEKGRIESLTGQMNITTGAAKLRAVFPNADKRLWSGTSGRILIPRTLDNVLVIPQSATFQLQNKILTFRVQGDSLLQTHIGVTTTPDGQQYVVNEGLAEGDKIVTGGLISLRNGQKVRTSND